MPPKVDFSKLKASWTKYDAVQIIEILIAKDLPIYLSGAKTINKPILRAVLGIEKDESQLPYYWQKIYSYPKQLRIFSLVAALFTHHNNIKKFADKYTRKGQLGGVFTVESKDKVATNIRSALVVSGASLENYRKKIDVPFNFSALFENGEVGLLMKDLLKNRLQKIGYSEADLQNENDFVKYCQKHDFIGALGMHKNQFERWVQGESIDSNQEIFKFSQLDVYKEISVLRINQWMSEWDDIDFKSPLRRKPPPVFYMFSIDARLLKRLSDVHRRKADGERAADIHVQRQKNDVRIEEISKYIEGGFPWSTISKQDQKLPENEDLKMPGLLPTAIIANILGEGEKRNGITIEKKDRISIEDEIGKPTKLKIPNHIFNDDSWEPVLKPIEIIDGQHRLWAFDENQNLSGNYELPVIAFNNLDRAWQAYLFYTINIKPVKINTSLGFDLYPLLRTQSWLEKSKDGLLAYRETRAQEIVEALWNYPKSAWYKRINMIGESMGLVMSQAAFIRAIVNSFFRRTRGIFGDTVGINFKVLDWNRAQQSAFIILLWNAIGQSVKECTQPWAEFLRSEPEANQTFENKLDLDLAFTSKNSFLTRDQGVRGILSFANDLFYAAADNNDIDFNSFIWVDELDESTISNESITTAIHLFNSNSKLIHLINSFAHILCKIDWRTSTASFIDNDPQKEIQMKYRGSGGYSEFWKDLYKVFKDADEPLIKKYVNQIPA
ncbi:MAG TPA: DGQHR domain-containing protein [Chitinophagaceae bacterium]